MALPTSLLLVTYWNTVAARRALTSQVDDAKRHWR